MSFKARNFSQAIEELERFTEGATEMLKPHLEDLKENLEEGVKKTKHKAEEKIQENPWAAIGIVGLVFFVLGFLFGFRRGRD